MSESISHVRFLPDPDGSGHPCMTVVWDEGSSVLAVTREDTSEMGQVPDEGLEPEPVGESFPLLGVAEALFNGLSAGARSATAESPVADRTSMLEFLARLEAHPEEVDGTGAELVAEAVSWCRTRLGAEAGQERP
jgi:hypothetical protein